MPIPDSAPLSGRSRLVSLDALRGYTIAGMIIVNTPGSWSDVFAPLRHASWHGLTPTDLVFPFFVFIVGVSIVLSMQKYRSADRVEPRVWRRIFVRVGKIFLVGIFLNLWWRFDVDSLRWAGVLQRIALVYGACACLFLLATWRVQVAVLMTLLLGYTTLLLCVPVPLDSVNQQALESGSVERSHGAVVAVDVEAFNAQSLRPNFEPGTNLIAWVDRRLLPGRLYERNWDPEGLLSTLPAIGTGLLGVLAGMILVAPWASSRRIHALFLLGVGCLVLGIAWSWVEPINKNLWSSSFVLVTAGCSLLCLASCALLADEWGYKRWTFVGKVFGSNAITAYALSGMLVVLIRTPIPGLEISLQQGFMQLGLSLGIAAKLVSLGWALLYAAFIFGIVYVFYRMRIFIRL